MNILTRRGAETHEPILMKLGMTDFVKDPTPHDHYGGIALHGIVWTCTWLVTRVLFFFLYFAFFDTHAGSISWLILMILAYTPKRVFLARDVPFGVSTISYYIYRWTPKTSPQNCGNRAFQA